MQEAQGEFKELILYKLFWINYAWSIDQNELVMLEAPFYRTCRRWESQGI